MNETQHHPHRLARRLARWLRRDPASDLSRLPDKLRRDVGLDQAWPDPRTIRSQHDAMRYSG